MIIRGARLSSKIITSFSRQTNRLFSKQVSEDTQDQTQDSLTFPYQFGNRMQLIPFSQHIFQAPFRVEQLEKKGYIEGFKFAYTRFLSALAFKDEEFLNETADSNLVKRFMEGTEDLEENSEKLILKAADGSIIKTMQHFYAICEEENRFQIQTKLWNCSIMQTPIWGREIDTKNYSQEYSSLSGPLFKVIVAKGGIRERLDLAFRSSALFHLVLQLTFEIKSDLILQTLPIKHKPERARPVKPETHYVQFEGKLGQLTLGSSDMLTQFKNQITGNAYQTAFENLEIEDIIISDFDNFHEGSRWIQ